MNHEELRQLVARIESITIDLNNELVQLRSLHNIREASRNTGRAPTEDYYGARSPRSKPTGSARKPDTSEETRGANGENKNKPEVGDTIKVVRGRNQGAIGIIVRETKSQYEISSERVVGKFRKWKNNVKLTKKRS